jgi:hypothetical protein
MNLFAWLFFGSLAAIVLLTVGPKVSRWLFGAWWLTGWAGSMQFPTRASAERYKAGKGLFAGADPYRVTFTGPIMFSPGVLLRKTVPPGVVARGRGWHPLPTQPTTAMGIYMSTGRTPSPEVLKLLIEADKPNRRAM